MINTKIFNLAELARIGGFNASTFAKKLDSRYPINFIRSDKLKLIIIRDEIKENISKLSKFLQFSNDNDKKGFILILSDLNKSIEEIDEIINRL